MRKTQNYNLPIFEQGESPAWIGDWNSTMKKIDQIGGGGSTDVTDKVFEYTAGNTYSNIANTGSFTCVLNDVTKDSFIELRMTCGASDNQMHIIQLAYYIEDATTENNIFNASSWHQCLISGDSHMTGYLSTETPIFKSEHPVKVRGTVYYSGSIDVSCEVFQYSKTATNA